MMKRCSTGLVALVLAAAMVGQARAGVIQLTSPSQLNGSDTTAIYTGSDGDSLASPYMLPAGGNTLTFTSANGTDFLRADQGNTWTGAFANGTKLLWNMDSNGNIGGPDTISFATGVAEAGLQVQQDHHVDTTFTAAAYNGSTLELSITVTVPDSGSGPGNLGFIGFKATGSDVITSIVISSVDSVDSSYNNDFVMGPVTFGNVAAVPEPSSLALAGVSTLCLLAYGWRRRQRASGQ